MLWQLTIASFDSEESVRKASSDCGICFFTAALSATMVNRGKASSADLK